MTTETWMAERPTLMPAPAFALKALFGEFATELLTSKRVLPSRAQESRFKQEFGGLDRALADLLA
jgi:NAD dependent epimerase/dehydratase family enzyme